jgi:hypothetical protein
MVLFHPRASSLGSRGGERIVKGHCTSFDIPLLGNSIGSEHNDVCHGQGMIGAVRSVAVADRLLWERISRWN